ncbi:ROK family transcriptional regulator [Devosia yakushimensis]|nr:ROK family transcriptional regulator [Devosia yakushimensis]
MNPSFIRHLNALKIFHAIRSNPGITQKSLTDLVGTDKTTTSSVVNSFHRAGLIERVRQTERSGAGRPSDGFAISPRGGLLVGVEIRGGHVMLIAAGLDGRPQTSLSLPMAEDQEGLGDQIANGLRGITIALGRELSEVRAVGLAAPGGVSIDGRVTEPMVSGLDRALKEMIEGAIGAPLYINNNSNGGALAELFFARGGQSDDFLYVETDAVNDGQGLGSGIIIGGALHRGSNGFAGELGHVKHPTHLPLRCVCGKFGCLCTLVADKWLLERSRIAGNEVASMEQLLDQASLEVPAALAVLHQAGTALGQAVGNFLNMLDVTEVVFGGSLVRLEPFLRDKLRHALFETTFRPIAEPLTVSFSRLGEAPLDGIAIALDGCTNDLERETAPWHGTKPIT